MTDRDVEALLAWYRRARRPLPWRFTREPYAILVAEVMLQQTQAARVVTYYECWMARFPDPAAIDTNVRRVLERHDGRRRTVAEVRRRAAGLLPVGRAGEFNQAMMELGATVCRARRPACGGCPVRSGCASAGRTPEAATARRRVRVEDEGGAPGVPVARRRVPVEDAGGAPGVLVARRRVRFEDTDRWARGRVVAALVAGHPPPALDAARRERALTGLECDGLVTLGADGEPRLP